MKAARVQLRQFLGFSEIRKWTATKTPVGARRQTIIVSVLESLRLYLPTFTLVSIIDEINRWWQVGQSCFTRLLKKMELPCPSESILDNVMPVPDG